jgi:hypothetical protein
MSPSDRRGTTLTTTNGRACSQDEDENVAVVPEREEEKRDK